jgi:hypothetical protein
MSSESPNPGAAPQQGQGDSSAQAAQAIQGRDIAGRFAANGSVPHSSGTNEEPKPPDELVVKWGDVDRRVKIQDLVQLAMGAEQAKAQAEAALSTAKSQTIKSAALEALAGKIETMTPQQRESLRSLLEKPERPRTPAFARYSQIACVTARRCASLKAEANAEPRCPLVPNATRSAAFSGFGFLSA